MIKLPAKPSLCELCKRPVPELTRHHLIPKRLHRKKRFQSDYSREHLITATLWVCRPCHNAIHQAATEVDLGLHYNSKDKLLQLADLRHFVEWISTKPAGFVPR